MSRIDAASNRASLRFAEEVIEHFSFLKKEGFDLLNSNSTVVSYGSASVIVNVYHGRQSYEIGVSVENIESSKAFSLSELLRLCGNRADDYRNYVGVTPVEVARSVRRLALIAKPCLVRRTLEDPRLFERLEKLRAQWAERFAYEQDLRTARRTAEEAWRKRDYATVVRSLGPFQASLTRSDTAKLHYAEKQLTKRV